MCDMAYNGCSHTEDLELEIEGLREEILKLQGGVVLTTEYSTCPKCGSDKLKYINEVFATYDCEDCGQRMDKRDYVRHALENFSHKMNVNNLFASIYDAVNG